MSWIALQTFWGGSTARLWRRSRQRLLPRFPHTRGRLDASHILQAQLGEAGAELRVVPITGIGQHHAQRDPLLESLPNLLQRNFRLGLKFHALRNADLPAALGILTPHLRQVQSPRDRQARVPRAHRQTHGHLAVILFAYLTAVLPSHSHGMLSLLGKTRIIHNPRYYLTVFQHGWQHITPHCGQHLLVVPRSVRYQMMQRLMHAANILRS